MVSVLSGSVENGTVLSAVISVDNGVIFLDGDVGNERSVPVTYSEVDSFLNVSLLVLLIAEGKF